MSTDSAKDGASYVGKARPRIRRASSWEVFFAKEGKNTASPDWKGQPQAGCRQAMEAVAGTLESG